MQVSGDERKSPLVPATNNQARRSQLIFAFDAFLLPPWQETAASAEGVARGRTAPKPSAAGKKARKFNHR
jgi:hypothetical protein